MNLDVANVLCLMSKFFFLFFVFCSIEWSAEDPHSGIDSITWRIYDADDTTLQHGIEHVPPQGNSQVLGKL